MNRKIAFSLGLLITLQVFINPLFAAPPGPAGRSYERDTEYVLAQRAKAKKDTSPPETYRLRPKIVEQLTDDGLITLNFHQVDIRELLSAMAMKREMNIVMAQEVSGKVSLHLYRVTLDEALGAITLAGGFDYIKRGTAYYVYKPKETKDPEFERLQMRMFKLRYVKPDKIQEVLNAIAGKRAIKVHEPSNTVIVEDTPENIKKVAAVIRFWDKMPKQVMIEAKILRVALTDQMSLGVNWDKILGDARIATGGFSTAVAATAGAVSPVPAKGVGLFANLITSAGTDKEFSAALDALHGLTKVNTLSTPKLLAIHGRPAQVQVGGQQGYPVTTFTATGLATRTIKFIDTGTILDITPYIDDKGNVLLNVKPTITSVEIDSTTQIPTVSTTTASTWLLAKSGETVLIAGLIEDTGIKTRNMIPCIGNIPGLGWLFRQTGRRLNKTELVVLITPQVVKSELRRLDQEAIERTRQVGEELKREPLPVHKELFD
jgi:type II secretory pathway component GspD/PulD (secretin)